MENEERQPSLNSVRPAPTGQDSDPSVSDPTGKPLKFGDVPRKALNKETYEPPGCSKYEIDEDIMARLGFEPEGSATKPSFCEGCLSLQGLLSDRIGYKEFYEYLQQQKHESLLDFWRSCEEFRRSAQSGSNLATRSANAIYSNYMHKKQLCGEILQDAIRAKVKHTLNSGQQPNQSLFDSAQEAILSYINEIHYPKFIRLDVYRRRISAESVKNSSKDRRNTGRFVGPALEPLPEEKVLAFDGEHHHGQRMGYDTLRSQSRASDCEREGYVLQSKKLSKAVLAGMYSQPAPVVSVNDSDVQSLSSDALTDDSKSTVTDFSDFTSKCTEKRSTQRSHDIPGFLPRTKRLPKGRKQLQPNEFAKILCEKLEKLLIQREQEERAAINLASLPHDQSRESKREKSILEDACERHHQYQQASFNLVPPQHTFTEPCYPIHGNPSIISSASHASFIEPCQMPAGYYPSSEQAGSASGKWGGCISENMMEKPCVVLVNNEKQWESLGTIESAPDSGVSIEEDPNLPSEARNRILQWMEQGEKVATQIQHSNYTKTRTKHPAFNISHPGLTDQGAQHLLPIVQDPLMPPLPQPDPTNTIEEVSRRLSQKTPREKRSKMHHKSRPGYTSSRSSQMTCPPQFSSDSADCSSSVLSGDNRPAMYSSSSVLSSVPSTVNSNDSGLGSVQKKSKKPVDGTRILYHLPGESVPYQSTLPGKVLSLGEFKDLINFKKGNYRYFCYKKTHEEDVGAVYEEITDDAAALPCFGNKIICKVKVA